MSEKYADNGNEKLWEWHNRSLDNITLTDIGKIKHLNKT